MPIIETQAGDVSAYIPTNVISITDGQMFLESDLFYSGVRPAINVGISVSRVGGNAQIKAMKKVAGSLRLALSQYRDLEAFAAFASDLDRASRAQLERGARLVELLKQSNYAPVPVQEQVVTVWSGTEGKLDDVPVAEVRRFETEFLASLRRSHASTLADIAQGRWDDDIVAALDAAVAEFKRLFLAVPDAVRVNEPAADAMEPGTESRETVTRIVPPTTKP